MINLQTKLIGNIIKLRPLLSSDFQELYKAASDKFIWQQHQQTKRCQLQYFSQKYFKPGLQSKSLLIVQNHNNQIKGCSGFYKHRKQYRDIMIGYTFLTRDCWGGNFNRQLKFLMLKHIFNYVDTVYFQIAHYNYRSQRAAQKLGIKLMSKKQINLRKIIPDYQHDIYMIDKDMFEENQYLKQSKQQCIS